MTRRKEAMTNPWMAALMVGLLVAPAALALGWVASQQSAGTASDVDPLELSADHAWLAHAERPEAAREAVSSHSDKLTADFVERLAYARADGTVRFVASLTHRDEALEASVEALLGGAYWLGDRPAFIGAADADTLAILLEHPAILRIEADHPLPLASSNATLAMNVRSNGTHGAGEGIWRYNATGDRIESDVPDLPPLTGRNVTVALIDTGVDKTHPDFFRWDCAPGSTEEALEWWINNAKDETPLPCPSRIKASVAMAPLVNAALGGDTTADVESMLPTDQFTGGHGTHMAGLVAGNAHITRNAAPDPDTYGGDGYVFGAAPDASIVSVNVYDAQRLTDVSSTLVEAGLQWAIDHAEEFGIRVIANGWDCLDNANNLDSCRQPGPQATLQAAYEAGLVVVSAVGNGGLSMPATVAHVVGVGSYDDDLRTATSAPGSSDLLPDPASWRPEDEPPPGLHRADVVAPGVGLWTPNPVTGNAAGNAANNAPRDIEGPYTRMSGTSASTALTAGTALLLVEACPDARPLDIMRALFMGAHRNPVDLTSPDGSAAPNHIVGYGAVDAHIALDWLMGRVACASTLPPEIHVVAAEGDSGTPFLAAGHPITFLADVTDPDGRVESWAWDFGDGNSSSEESPTHTYAAPGEYVVRLLVTDDEEARDLEHHTIRVRAFEPMDVVPPEDLPITEDSPWASGSGTHADPLVIENLRVDMTPPNQANDETLGSFKVSDQPSIGYSTIVDNIVSGTELQLARAIQITNTGLENITIRNVWVRYVDPDGSALRGGGHTAIAFAETDWDADVRVEDVVVCGSDRFRFDTAFRVPQGAVLRNVTACHAETGIVPARASVNDRVTRITVDGCTIHHSDIGIDFNSAGKNLVRGCRLHDNDVALQLSAGSIAVDTSEVFDNEFRSNAQDVRHAAVDNGNKQDETLWTAHFQPLPGTNILGQPGIAGNHWADEDIKDADGDGFGDKGEHYEPTSDPDGKSADASGGDFRVLGIDTHPLVPLPPDPPLPDFSSLTSLPVAGRTPAVFQDASTSPDGIVQHWSWDFGDGTYRNTTDHMEDVVQHMYTSGGTIEVTLTVTDEQGTSSHVTKLIDVNTPPVAAFNPSRGGLQATLDAACTQTNDMCAWDADGDALTVTWDPGGAGSFIQETDAASPKAFFLYDTPGTYMVNLTVTDARGATSYAEEELTVADDAQPPVVGFQTLADGAKTLETIAFQDTSFDPDGILTDWRWEFGDGSVLEVSGPPPACAAGTAWCVDDMGRRLAHHTYATPGDYLVNLTVTDNTDTASAELQKTVSIANRVPAPTLSMDVPTPFSDDPSILHTVDILHFKAPYTDPDGTIESWHWDFGGTGRVIHADGSTSPALESVTTTSDEVRFRYRESGQHTVTVNLTDDFGGTGEDTIQLDVLNTPPAAAFTWSCNPACPDGPTTEHTLHFTDASNDRDEAGFVANQEWEILDGSGGTLTDDVGVSLTHRFVDNGTYTVRLNVTDGDGAFEVAQETISVGNVAPTADFLVHPPKMTVVDDVTFLDRATDSDGTIASRLWDFGDGNTSTEPFPVHRYGAVGEYDVTYTVIDDDGVAASVLKTLHVESARPVAEFTWSIDAEELTTQTPVHFRDLSHDPDGSIVERQWDFGDGSSLTTADPDAVVTHTYSAGGLYKAILSVVDDRGLVGKQSVLLNVENVAPNLDITFTPETPAIGQKVAFSPAVTDPDGGPVAFLWEFGDGGNSAEREPTYTYTRKGGYPVRLTVEDDAGEKVTVSRILQVGNVAPQARFDLPDTPVVSGQVVRFTDRSTDPDGVLTSWRWDFGDGETSDSQDTVHVFRRSGSYEVTLTVRDDDGATNSSLLPLEVTNAPPDVDFSVTPLSNPTAVRLVPEVVDVDGDVVSWQWSFGDGNTSEERSPRHEYAGPGEYVVRLRVVDNDSGVGEHTRTINVFDDPPKIDLAHEPVQETRRGIRFSSQGEDVSISSWKWDFGDGNTSSAPSPVHEYEYTGAYLVTLEATDIRGNSVFLHETVEVKDEPSRHGAKDDRGIPAPPWLVLVGILGAGLIQPRRSSLRGSKKR